MTAIEHNQIGSIVPRYRNYGRQKCFIAYTKAAPWSVDLMSACEEILHLPEYNLEADYAGKHFDPDVTLSQKARDLIANARYGIYDLSHWRDEQGQWQLPRNVLIELGMAIALNRPTLLLRHASNEALALPECLRSVSGNILKFGGEFTLKDELKQRLPQWLDAPPERDWWNRYCIFGNRKCEYREAHPRARQWGHRELACHISDGPDPDRVDFRCTVEKVLERFSDLKVTHLDSLPLASGYDFLLCSYCQAVRSTSFAIYRITPNTPAETFIAIGISIALEDQFEYSIPRLLLTEKMEALPSLLLDREVCIARNNKEMKDHLMRFMPSVMQKVREIVYKPKPLPFIDVTHVELSDEEESFEEGPQALIEAGIKLEDAGQLESAIASFKKATEIDPKHTVALLRLGEAYLKSGRLPEAEEYLRQAHSIEPANSVVVVSLGKVLLEAKKHDQAITTFELAISLNVDDLAPRMGLAEAAKASGAYGKAEAAYRESIVRFPEYNALRTGYADLLLRERKTAEAEQVYREIVQRSPDNLVAVCGFADTLKSLRRFDAAEQVYRDAVSKFPQDTSVRNGLASVLLARNRRMEAEDIYRETLTLFPEDTEAKSGLASLQTSQQPARKGKIRIYDLAKELKLDTKRLVEEVRREGVDVSVPSNLISYQLAEKIRNKYFPKKETTVKRGIRVVKRAERPIEGASTTPFQSGPPRQLKSKTGSAVRVLRLQPMNTSDLTVKKLTPRAGTDTDNKRPTPLSQKEVGVEEGGVASAPLERISQESMPKLYISNLSFSATEDDLRAWFSQVGVVRSASVVKDVADRSRGFGFVEMSTPVEAEEAIRRLNNKELLGRRAQISQARPKARKK